jgi:hypothetical protein
MTKSRAWRWDIELNLRRSQYAVVILCVPLHVKCVALIDDYSHKIPHFYSCQGL